MKLPFYGFMIFLCMQGLAYGQESNEIQLDSVISVINEAFDLSQQSKYGEAIKISNEVLEYAKHHKSDLLKARALNVLGISYSELGEANKSMRLFIEAKKLYEKIKDTSKIIIANNNLGVMYQTKGNDKESNVYFEKALEIAEKAKKYDSGIYPAFNIGYNLIYEKGDFEQGIQYLDRTLRLVEKVNDLKVERIKTDTYEALGYAHHKIKNKEKSFLYYEKALQLSEADGYLESLQRIYENRARLYAEDKEFEKANELLYKLIKVNDSIKKVTNFEQVKKIEAEYFVKENKNKLKLIESEKASQEAVIAKSRIYNLILIVFSCILLLNVYWIFKKNKQLRLAKEKAESLSKVKSDFYSEISHELRTPLYAVIELTGLLLREEVSIKHKEYLESLKFSGSHLLSLINNVLELNKVESGKMKIQLLDFDLKNLLSNIIDSLEYALRNSNNTINLKYDNDIPNLLVGDSLKLSQIFINLISNAIKFTNNGHIEIVVNQISETDKEVRIYFKVSDNGLGISKEKQAKIFEEFYQEHAKTKKSYNGTGLGLSIVKRILTAMDSDIGIESEEQKGASFFFELTFEKKSKSNEPVVLYSSQLEAIKGSHILVVDDNKINQLVTKKVLDSLEMKSKTVDSGTKAIEAVKNEKFDCILMDLHMPELDGYETTRLIREFNKEVPIVALTAASTDEVEAKIRACDMDGYVLKPFITTEFVQVMNNAIHRDL